MRSKQLVVLFHGNKIATTPFAFTTGENIETK